MTLKQTFGNVQYTANEEAIYDFIASRPNRTASSKDVIAMFYSGRRQVKNARIIVGGMLNSLKSKLDENRERYTLKKSERSGPHPILWQLVQRPARKTARRSEARAAA